MRWVEHAVIPLSQPVASYGYGGDGRCASVGIIAIAILILIALGIIF
ncbi:MAG TPA: hypothetical protein VN456_13990 [Desulfosporosinus sp.]|nr:hypothetical protein [Desulfosporosinus sp.]